MNFKFLLVIGLSIGIGFSAFGSEPELARGSENPEPCFRRLSELGLAKLKLMDPKIRFNDPNQSETEAVETYISRFPHTTNLPREASYALVEQLAQMDFRKPRPFRVWLTVETRPGFFRIASMTIAPYLIQGWKDLKMIADSRWNLEIDPASILSNLEKISGWSRAPSSVLSKRGIISQFPYARYMGMRNLIFEDFHDFLFHAPFLSDPIRREFARIAFRFDYLLAVTDGAESYMNALYEYGGSHLGGVLLGPMQLTPWGFPGGHQNIRESQIDGAIPLLKKADLSGFKKFRENTASWFPILKPEERSWWLALELMRMELEKFRSTKSITRSIGQMVDDLLSDIQNLQAQI